MNLIKDLFNIKLISEIHVLLAIKKPIVSYKSEWSLYQHKLTSEVVIKNIDIVNPMDIKKNQNNPNTILIINTFMYFSLRIRNILNTSINKG